MDPLRQIPISIDLDQAKSGETPLTSSDENSLSPLTGEQLANLSRAIFLDMESHEYDFHSKVLKDAQAFIQRKLDYYGFNLKVDFPEGQTKDQYFKNSSNQDVYEKLNLDISFSWYQEKIPKKVMQKLISELNKEFNLERRFGLFLLEEYSNSYSILFNPNPMSEKAFDYLNSDRFLFRTFASETFHPCDRLDKDEIFALHMENALLETVLAKDPASKENPAFVPIRDNSTWGLQTWIYDNVSAKKIIDEIKEWNSEYNVDKRAGVFRHQSFGHYFHLWFQASEGNQGYQDLKDELLTDDAIANIESRYNIVFDERTEWIHS